MLRSARTCYFLALSLLVALGGALATFRPGSSSPLTPLGRPGTSIGTLRSGFVLDTAAAETSNVLLAATPQEAEPPSDEHPERSGPLHTVKRGESLASLAFRYLPQTKYMTTAELEAAIREANPSLAGARWRPDLQIEIPGIEPQPIVERPRPKAKETEIRAIYLTGWTAGSERGLSLIRRWKEAGGNAICFDIKDFDGEVTVPFDHPLKSRRAPLIRNLPKFIRFMHQMDLHVIARIALFRDEHLAKNYPQFAVRSRRTGGPWRENGKQVWTDPSRREVQDYNLALARLAVAAGADEIQFDYVRFPAEGDQADATFEFESWNAAASPAGEASPSPSPQAPPWTRSRVITEFLERAYKEIHSTGVLFSLDVFGVMAWERSVDLAHTGQNIAEMARHCDVLSPMIYPSHFFGMDGYGRPGDAPEHFIGSSMKRFREITAGSGVVLRPWLQAFAWRTPSYSPEYIVTQVRVAQQNGGVGYLFWNANNDYSKPFAAMPALRTLPKRAEPEPRETAASQLPAIGPNNPGPEPDESPDF
jgi:hypothetical protein